MLKKLKFTWKSYLEKRYISHVTCKSNFYMYKPEFHMCSSCVFCKNSLITLRFICGGFSCDSRTYHDINAVHGTGGGQSPNPVGYQRALTHRQQRLRDARQVSEPSGSVRADIPLQPGPVTGGEDDSFHISSLKREKHR